MASYSSLSKACAALAVSGVVHLAVIAYLNLDEAPEVAGGATTEVAALGSSFEELVTAGDQLEPVEAAAAASDTEPNAVETVDPENAAEAPPDEAEPVEVEAPLPIEPQTVEIQTPQAATAVEPTETAISPSIASAGNVPPERVNTAAPPSRAIAVAPKASAPREERPEVTPVQAQPTPSSKEATAIASVTPEALTPIDEPVITEPIEVPSEDLTAVDVPVPALKPPPPRRTAAPTSSAKQRPKAAKKRAAKKPKTTQKTAKRQGQRKATAAKNQRKGRVDGQVSGRSKDKGNKGTKRQKAGNAAVSNYPGKVQRRIARTRQKRVGGRGTARVRFVISAAGGLASVSIAKSSGSPAVDRAALDHIRRAAPFPKPPPGARRRYVIPVRVQG